MDKMNVALWDQYFGNTEQQVLYSSERYAHFAVAFQQQGLAKGSINAIDTPGMLFTDLYIDAGKPFSLYDDISKETAESVFVLQGKVESRFKGRDILYFNNHQHNIQYSNDFSGTHIIHSPRFHACTITYHDDYLNSLFESEPGGSLGLFSRQLQKKQDFLGTTGSLGWQQRIGELIQAIRQCPFRGITKYIFTESKLLELFVLQMEQVAALQDKPAKAQWLPCDKEKLYAVKEFIAAAYLEPLSLQSISAKFGLNEFKLKKGYKHFFGNTVFGDIHSLRMQYARRLLAERAMNVTEVAYHIGYNDLSSFSYAFKKAFGCSPKGSDVVQLN